MAAAVAPSALIRCSINAQRPRVAPRRLSAPAARHARHVCWASKLAEMEVNSAKADKKKLKEEEEEEEFFEGADDGLSPQQVESLLSVLCEETEIAEVDLKIGGFKLRVRRNVGAAASAAVAAPAPAAPAPAAPAAPAFSPAPSVASSYESETFDEEDGSVITVTANKVGILRRGRYVKGKQVGKAAMVNSGDSVKKGQAIAFVEQLGTHWPVESPQAGELLDFLLEDGDPVEYGQAVAEMAPFFGGHIIGEAKHA